MVSRCLQVSVSCKATADVQVYWTSGMSRKLTLILSISALHLFMHALLYLALQDTRADALLILGRLEDVSRIDPVIPPPSHDVDPGFRRKFINRDLQQSLARRSKQISKHRDRQPACVRGGATQHQEGRVRDCRAGDPSGSALTLLYVAEKISSPAMVVSKCLLR